MSISRVQCCHEGITSIINNIGFKSCDSHDNNAWQLHHDKSDLSYSHVQLQAGLYHGLGSLDIEIRYENSAVRILSRTTVKVWRQLSSKRLGRSLWKCNIWLDENKVLLSEKDQVGKCSLVEIDFKVFEKLGERRKHYLKEIKWYQYKKILGNQNCAVKFHICFYHCIKEIDKKT